MNNLKSSNVKILKNSYFYNILICLLFIFITNISFAKQDEKKTNISYVDAVVLGVVEGATEYLPISSTGHLIIATEALNLNENIILNPQNEDTQKQVTLKSLTNSYCIIIQFGAILAVLMIYKNRILQMLRGVFLFDKSGLLLIRNLLLGFMPAVVLGLLFKDIIEEFLFGIWPVALSLILGGFFMIWIEKVYRKKSLQNQNDKGNSKEKLLEDLSVKDSLMIGILQCVAMWPGTSRSMMTIAGGYFAKLSPKKSAEFSFLLGLITLSAASFYKSYDTGKQILENLDILPLIIGIIVATISALLSVKWFVEFLSKNGLMIFAYYRIILGIILFGLFVIF